jgi:hypothetical protein
MGFRAFACATFSGLGEMDIRHLEAVHRAVRNNAAAVDEHHVGQNLFDLFHLMGGHHDGAADTDAYMGDRRQAAVDVDGCLRWLASIRATAERVRLLPTSDQVDSASLELFA